MFNFLHPYFPFGRQKHCKRNILLTFNRLSGHAPGLVPPKPQSSSPKLQRLFDLSAWSMWIGIISETFLATKIQCLSVYYETMSSDETASTGKLKPLSVQDRR
jgi:hypothetical protein